MTLYAFLNTWLFLFIIGQTSAIPYNLPKFCPNATWNSTAITFANVTTVGTVPYGIFVSTNNTVYVANRLNNQILVWLEGSIVPTRNTSGNLSYPASVVLSDTNDMYVDNGYANFRVDQWLFNSTSIVSQMYVCKACYGLFIDISNNIYCSMYDIHQVNSKSLTNRLNVWSIVAGTGTAGSTSVTLYNPRGIFVDAYLNLYVADSVNDRIQKFPSGQLNGTTVAGNGAPGTITLYYPSGVVLDGNGYLFIVDSYNHRIVGSGPNGFQCIAACSGLGSTSNQLYYPLTLSFDTYGNMFVTDQYNNRIQKFILATNSCGGTTATTITTSTTQLTTPSTSTSYSNAVSYNQPKFSAFASWSGNAITFATSGTVGGTPYGMFVNTNNTVYVANRESSKIQVWLEGNSIPTMNITMGLSYPYSLFATSNGNIYVDNGYSNGRVDKWSSNGTGNSSVMYVKSACYGIFVDILNNIYCSMYTVHQVVTKSLNSNSSMWIVAAGMDCYGSAYNQLYYPCGIFVDTGLNLYVADSANNRVQLFGSGQATAITVAGATAIGTISLYYPSGVILDGNGYLFIVDSYNHRIVGSGPNGFRCIVGCSSISGSSSNQLSYPSALNFDSYGNIFVLDQDNNRVQKFILLPNTTYAVSYNQPKFCPSTTWYTDGITFANISTVGSQPFGLFVTNNNTLYVANRDSNLVQMWLEGSINPDRTIMGGLSSPLSLFATVTHDLYVDNGVTYNLVEKFISNTNTSTPTMSIPEECYSIFIDIRNTIYCAACYAHQIVKKWLNDNTTTSIIVAGTGGAGSTSNTLYYPAGVWVDINFNLYVADCGNDRIQMFALGQSNAITVAGNGAPGTITLDCPSAVALDGNGYLFIEDLYTHRILGSGPYGFRCLFGCLEIPGSASNELYYPRTFAFDTYGNMFVADVYNNRIQKFVLASNSCTLSYNQPKFCADAFWYANASTVLSSSIIGILPYGIFVDGINTLYVANGINGTVSLLPQWYTTPTRTISGNLSQTFSVFVSISGDIYVDNGYSNGRVDKWIFNTSTTVNVMNINGSCYGLFIDSSNTLYCSIRNFHQVVKTLLNNGINMSTIAAGNGSAGLGSNMLNYPQGIYVDANLNLYVADCGNNRVQVIQSGPFNGVTVAGNGASGAITLNCPTGVVLDTDGYLFIVDSNNHRIIGSGFYGFRCIVGCSGGGSASYQLFYPQSMAFDSYGNIFVSDRNNSRIQKFIFINNTCGALFYIKRNTIEI